MPASVWSIEWMLVALAHHMGDPPRAWFSASVGCDRATPTVFGVITNHPVNFVSASSPNGPDDRAHNSGPDYRWPIQ